MTRPDGHLRHRSCHGRRHEKPHPPHGIRSLIASRAGILETLIVGGIASLCLLVAAVFVTWNSQDEQHARTTSTPHATKSSRLPKDICSAVGTERLDSLVEYPVTSHHEEEAFGVSDRTCVVRTDPKQPDTSDLLYVRASRYEQTLKTSGEDHAQEIFRQNCKNVTSIRDDHNDTAIRVPDFTGLGDQYCVAAFYNSVSKKAKVRLIVQRREDLLVIRYQKTGPDGERPLRDAAQLARDLLTRL